MYAMMNAVFIRADLGALQLKDSRPRMRPAMHAYAASVSRLAEIAALVRAVAATLFRS